MKNLRIVICVLSFALTAMVAKSQSLIIRGGIQIGDKAPEISETAVNGQPLKLSSITGKMVLIDFWASWCRPCRNENPSVVAAYEKYKDADFKGGKGFTVFSISLDRDVNAWKEAIQADHLTWQSHVCNPKGNADYLRIYEIRSIPTNFLIDSKGVILATNLRGAALEEKLASLKK